MLHNILIALDGESHTSPALIQAVDLARRYHAVLTGLHVIDPYLKQFHNEIYAVGRQEYLDHVDRCLIEIANRTLHEFEAYAKKENIRFEAVQRRGDPLEEIISAVKEMEFDLMIVGGKRLGGFKRWRSGNLPEKLLPLVNIPLLIVRRSSMETTT